MSTFISKKPRGKRPRLAELSAELIMLILHLRATEEFGNEAELRQKVKALLDSWERKCKQADVDFEEVRLAKFALVAFLDETIITSEWSQRDSWIANPLQLELYERFDAGEEFFKKLEEIRQRAKAHSGVLEIYYLCMALGFEGMYQLHNKDKLSWIIEDTYNDLRQATGKSTPQLAPHARSRDEIVEAVTTEIPLWVIAVAATVLCVFVYLVLAFMIDNKAETVKTVIERSI